MNHTSGKTGRARGEWQGKGRDEIEMDTNDKRNRIERWEEVS